MSKNHKNDTFRNQFLNLESKVSYAKFLNINKLTPQIPVQLLVQKEEEVIVVENARPLRMKKTSWGVYPILGYRSTVPNKNDAFFVTNVAQQNLRQRLGMKGEANRHFFENKRLQVATNLQAGAFRQSFDFQVLNLYSEHKTIIQDGPISHIQTSFDKHGIKEDFWSSFLSLGATASHKIAKSERHKLYGSIRGLLAMHAKNVSASPAFDLGYTFSTQKAGYKVVVQPQLSYLSRPLNVPVDYFQVKNYQVGVGVIFEPK